MMNYIIPIATIIVASEFIRNILIAQNTKSTKVITFIIMVLVDLIVYANGYDLTDFDKFVEIMGFTLFSSISCNLLYNYTSKRYGPIPIIIYRLLTVLYVYIIPIIPNVYMFFRSVLRTVYPYIVYQIIDYTYGGRKMSVAHNQKRNAIISKILICAATVGVAMLVSCEFTYGILVIGSGSMTGTINMGDVVIYEKYDGSEVKEGDIIIFNDSNIQVIHRVIDVKKINGEVRYITKGDANNAKDEGYITNSDIAARYILRIPYSGWMSLWLRDLFSN